MIPFAAIAGKAAGLLGGWKKWVAIGAAFAGVALFAYVQTLRLAARAAELELVQRERDQAIELAETNAEAARQIRAHAVHTIKALEATAAAAAARARRHETIRSGVLNAPDADDGPVAPVLQRVFDELRAGSPGAGDPDRKVESAGQPVALRRGADAARSR